MTKHRRSSVFAEFRIQQPNPRMLNLLSSLPLLAFAPSIHATKVDDDEDPEKKIINPMIEHLTTLFEHNTPQSDADFIMALVEEMFLVIKSDPDELLVYLPFPEWRDPAYKKPSNDNLFLYMSWFMRYSPRFRTMLLAVADQVVLRDGKAVIFFSNPFEQQLFTVILRYFNIAGVAALSTGKKDQSMAGIQDRFNLPLHRKRNPFDVLPKPGEIEALSGSYFLSASINLHKKCHDFHGSPPPNLAYLLQAIGRILRLGQKMSCLILEYIVRDTHNMAQVDAVTAQALAVVASLLRRVETGEGFSDSDMASYDDWYLYENSLIEPGLVTKTSLDRYSKSFGTIVLRTCRYLVSWGMRGMSLYFLKYR
jgi:hypothetical protein